MAIFEPTIGEIDLKQQNLNRFYTENRIQKPDRIEEARKNTHGDNNLDESVV